MATENGSQAAMEDSIKKLFDAMDIIAAQQIKNLQFDKTVKCSITDDSKSEQGEYTVTDGSSTFKAYSESTKYSNGASVYVNIPNGDYKNKKLITGRYDQDRKDYNTNDPEKSYIDITQNLISSSIGETGIVANGEKTQITIWDSGDNFNKKLEEEKKDDTKKDEGIKYKAYKKMLVKAKFKNYLSTKNVILGNYGIRIDILGEKKNTAEKTVEDWYMFKLDSSSMIGDPYKFEVGFEQKLLFDLDPDVNITRVRVVLYQDKNFYDKSKNLLAPSNFDDIFVSEPFVSFGYSLEDFTEDTVLLYTFDSKKYAEHLTEETKQTLAKQSEIESQKDSTKKAFTVEDLDKTDLYTEQLNKLNKKKIILRWVHETTGKDEKTRSFESVVQAEDIPTGAIIHWYKYDLTQGVTDKIAGAFWTEMVEQKNKFELEYSPNPKKSFEMFRVIVECMSREYVNNYLIANDEDILEIENKPEDKRTDEEKEKLDNLKNSYLEKIHDYISEDLKFENENMVPDENTIDLIKGLTITCDDCKGGYNGVYRIYDDAGKIMSSSEADKKRLFTASYTSIVSGVKELDTAEKIIWSIPKLNTMIYPPEEDVEYSFYDKIGTLDEDVFKKGEYFTFDSLREKNKKYQKAIFWDEKTIYYKKGRTQIDNSDQNYFKIIRYGVLSSKKTGDEEADSTQQVFRIKDYYTQSAINNTVYCTIYKNNREYKAEYTLAFGPVGTNGTEYTFTLELADKQPAVLCTLDTVQVIPHIYDYQNKEVTQDYITKIKYSWYSSNTKYSEDHKVKKEDGSTYYPSAIDIDAIDSTTGAVTLKINSHNIEDLNYFILQGKVTNATTIVNLNKYKDENGENKNVDGKVSTDELTENTGNQKPDGIKVSLYSYLPISIRSSIDYTTFDGATKISYNTAGVDPSYYKDPYKVYSYINQKTTPDTNIKWMMSYGKDTQVKDKDGNYTTNLKYYPWLNQNNCLIAPSMYLQNNGKEVSVMGYTFGSNGISIVWIQPLYIYQNVFTSALLNAWDGSLTFDEENGTILSTMMGAGKKDNQNRFNGVLMGNLSPAFNTEEGISALKDYYTGIGLYGFNEGQKSFGLNINGRAFFGKSGHGQILIDGNSGSIQSQRYLMSMAAYNSGQALEEPLDTAKEGMCIDVDNGTITAYGIGNNSMIKINPNPSKYEPYFVIRSGEVKIGYDSDGKKYSRPGENLIYIGDQNYYLQSHNFYDYPITEKIIADDGTEKEKVLSYGKGFKFDLNQGSLKAYDFSLKASDSSTGAYINLNSNGAPYFEIFGVGMIGSGKHKKQCSNTLLSFGKSSQFLQSLDFSEVNEVGTRLDLTLGRITSFDFGIKALKAKTGGIYIDSNGSPYLQIQTQHKTLTDENGNKKLINLFYASKNDFYIQSMNFKNSTEKNIGAGVKLDLNYGAMQAYNFTIKAVKSITNKETNEVKDYIIAIDSTVNDYPFKVGDFFRVSWSGKVEAEQLIATKGGQIGPFHFNGSALYTESSNFGSSGVYLGTSGLSVSNGNFKVDKVGNTTLHGKITGNSWSVTTDGLATFGNINATGGKVAGWTLGRGYFQNGDTKLSSNGLDFKRNYLHSDKLHFEDVDLSKSGLTIGRSVQLNSTHLKIGSNVELNDSKLKINDNTYLSSSDGLHIGSGKGSIILNNLKLAVGNDSVYFNGGVIGIIASNEVFTVGPNGFGAIDTKCFCGSFECGGSMTVNGHAGVNGTVTFEDGSYFSFSNGICVGVHIARS